MPEAKAAGTANPQMLPTTTDNRWGRDRCPLCRTRPRWGTQITQLEAGAQELDRRAAWVLRTCSLRCTVQPPKPRTGTPTRPPFHCACLSALQTCFGRLRSSVKALLLTNKTKMLAFQTHRKRWQYLQKVNAPLAFGLKGP